MKCWGVVTFKIRNWVLLLLFIAGDLSLGQFEKGRTRNSEVLNQTTRSLIRDVGYNVDMNFRIRGDDTFPRAHRKRQGLQQVDLKTKRFGIHKTVDVLSLISQLTTGQFAIQYGSVTALGVLLVILIVIAGLAHRGIDIAPPTLPFFFLPIGLLLLTLFIPIFSLALPALVVAGNEGVYIRNHHDFANNSPKLARFLNNPISFSVNQ